MKKLVLATLLFAAIISGVGRSTAQTATPTPAATTSGPSNSSQGTLFVCADSAVLEFSGTSLVGYDIFYQIFSGASGSGTAITGVRQVAVAGIYTASDRVTYKSGVTVAAGGSASAKVDIAREGNPTSIDFSYTLTDTQDGCNASSTTPASTEVPGSGTDSSASVTTNFGTASSIFAPNGGLLNPNLAPEPAVVVGARLSDRFRSDTPGLIFATCDAYPLAEPGIIYDSDTITIFWSWYTKTQKQMDQELANAIYTVKLNTATLPMTTRSEPVLRAGNYWVFYTATVGNLRPGHYEVGFLHTWANPVNDGYKDFGPGTGISRESGICNFDIKPNPNGVSVTTYSGMYFPSLYPTHDLPTPTP